MTGNACETAGGWRVWHLQPSYERRCQLIGKRRRRLKRAIDIQSYEEKYINKQLCNVSSLISRRPQYQYRQ